MNCFLKCVIVLIALAIGGCSFERVPPPKKTPRFNQQRAYSQLVQLCALGPRNNGSDGKKAAEYFIRRILTEAGTQVSFHTFEHTASGSSQPAYFTNIIGKIKPEATRRVLIGTHYDTRSWADRDPDEQKRNTPIIGANDGASGVALLLELALTWKDESPPVGVDLVFFDGEDFGRGQLWDDYFLGSKAWLRDHADYKVEWGIIVDMVGDASLEIKQERHSLDGAPAVVSMVWQAAKRVQSSAFRERAGGRLMDDHTAFLNKQIPVILLIDFDYPYFHTTEDTPDKCSAESLGQVGRAVMEAVESS